MGWWLMRDLTDLPSKCDGCGASLTMQHALDCKVGGLVIQRHNEIRDCIGDIAAQVWTQVVREPIVKEAETQIGDSGLRLDLGVHGIWQSQAEALFDFKVIDTDAPSYSNRSPVAVLESGAQDKKRIYKQAVEDCRGSFTPFVTSVDRLLHREAEQFLKRMATCVASKWKKSYAQTCGYIRARLSFAIIRAASLCLRGSRVKWRNGLGFEDGVALYSIMH